MSELVNIKLDDFAGSAHHEATTITARLTGSADHAAIEALDKLLTATHVRAQELGVSEAVIDLRALEFMSSSCFKCFVTWITQIQDLESSARYKLRFLSNPNMHWQKRSLRSLACFATELITVE